MGRRGKVGLLVGSSIVVLAALAWINRPRDEPTKVTVDEAVRSFRAKGDSAGERAGTGEPPPGVYRYGTRGTESVKTPLIGTSHDYGGVSTIVLSEGACGERERWQVLDGRWTEVEACPGEHDGGSATVTEFHEFFGSGQEDVFHCHSDAVSARPGARFASHCRSDDSSISNASRVIGVEEVAVGDESFATTHVQTRSAFGGENSGTAQRDEWRRRSDGLLLRRSVESEADTSKAGGTHYSERYTIRLLSTTPRR